MDEKVIQVIADELGMAVESAAQFMADILPQYATLKVIELSISTVFFGLLLIICLVAIAILTRKFIKKELFVYKYSNGEIERQTTDFGLTIVVIGIVALTCLGFLSLPLVDLIGWALAPEAKFFDMVLGKVV